MRLRLFEKVTIICPTSEVKTVKKITRSKFREEEQGLIRNSGIFENRTSYM